MLINIFTPCYRYFHSIAMHTLAHDPILIYRDSTYQRAKKILISIVCAGILGVLQFMHGIIALSVLIVTAMVDAVVNITAGLAYIAYSYWRDISFEQTKSFIIGDESFTQSFSAYMHQTLEHLRTNATNEPYEKNLSQSLFSNASFCFLIFLTHIFFWRPLNRYYEQHQPDAPNNEAEQEQRVQRHAHVARYAISTHNTPEWMRALYNALRQGRRQELHLYTNAIQQASQADLEEVMSSDEYYLFRQSLNNNIQEIDGIINLASVMRGALEHSSEWVALTQASIIREERWQPADNFRGLIIKNTVYYEWVKSQLDDAMNGVDNRTDASEIALCRRNLERAFEDFIEHAEQLARPSYRSPAINRNTVFLNNNGQLTLSVRMPGLMAAAVHQNPLMQQVLRGLYKASPNPLSQMAHTHHFLEDFSPFPVGRRYDESPSHLAHQINRDVIMMVTRAALCGAVTSVYYGNYMFSFSQAIAGSLLLVVQAQFIDRHFRHKLSTWSHEQWLLRCAPYSESAQSVIHISSIGITSYCLGGIYGVPLTIYHLSNIATRFQRIELQHYVHENYNNISSMVSGASGMYLASLLTAQRNPMVQALGRITQWRSVSQFNSGLWLALPENQRSFKVELSSSITLSALMFGMQGSYSMFSAAQSLTPIYLCVLNQGLRHSYGAESAHMSTESLMLRAAVDTLNNPKYRAALRLTTRTLYNIDATLTHRFRNYNALKNAALSLPIENIIWTTQLTGAMTHGSAQVTSVAVFAPMLFNERYRPYAISAMISTQSLCLMLDRQYLSAAMALAGGFELAPSIPEEYRPSRLLRQACSTIYHGALSLTEVVSNLNIFREMHDWRSSLHYPNHVKVGQAVATVVIPCMGHYYSSFIRGTSAYSTGGLFNLGLNTATLYHLTFFLNRLQPANIQRNANLELSSMGNLISFGSFGAAGVAIRGLFIDGTSAFAASQIRDGFSNTLLLLVLNYLATLSQSSRDNNVASTMLLSGLTYYLPMMSLMAQIDRYVEATRARRTVELPSRFDELHEDCANIEPIELPPALPFSLLFTGRHPQNDQFRNARVPA